MIGMVLFYSFAFSSSKNEIEECNGIQPHLNEEAAAVAINFDQLDDIESLENPINTRDIQNDVVQQSTSVQKEEHKKPNVISDALEDDNQPSTSTKNAPLTNLMPEVNQTKGKSEPSDTKLDDFFAKNVLTTEELKGLLNIISNTKEIQNESVNGPISIEYEIKIEKAPETDSEEKQSENLLLNLNTKTDGESETKFNLKTKNEVNSKRNPVYSANDEGFNAIIGTLMSQFFNSSVNNQETQNKGEDLKVDEKKNASQLNHQNSVTSSGSARNFIVNLNFKNETHMTEKSKIESDKEFYKSLKDNIPIISEKYIEALKQLRLALTSENINLNSKIGNDIDENKKKE
ncbi:hypothetical protein COBT_003434 [Conglomerata obtusa]